MCKFGTDRSQVGSGMTLVTMINTSRFSFRDASKTMAAARLCVLLAAAASAGASTASAAHVRLPAPRWGPCPFNATVAVECASVAVPRNWDDPLSDLISVFVSRVLATNRLSKHETTSTPTVWFLNGGSGVGGACGPGSAWITYFASKGFHVALPDMRGTGLCKPKLYCADDPEGKTPPSLACAKEFMAGYGPKGMYNFSVTMAAHDLAHLITTLGTENGKNYVQGDSFGTFWGQRFLTIYPDLADGAVMESFGVPNRYNYFEAVDNIAWAAKRLLQYCDADPGCAARMGAGMDTFAMLERVTQKAQDGTLKCTQRLPAKMGPDFAATIKHMVGYLCASGMRDTLAFIPAIMYRFARCSDDDVAVLEHAYDALGLGPKQQRAVIPHLDSSVCDISQPVLYSLFFSEGVLDSPPPTLSQLEQHWAGLAANVPSSDVAGGRLLYDTWPRYPLDKYAHKYTRSTRPLLFINGDLDISTPWDNAAFSTLYYTGANQTLVKIRTAPHVAFLLSPVTNTPVTCGLQLMMSFYVSAGASVDRSCLDELVPLDFLGTQSPTLPARESILGTGDLWNYDGPVNISVF